MNEGATIDQPGLTDTAGRRRFAYWLALAVLLSVIVRLWGIADRELWFDENCTFYVVHHLDGWPEDGPDFRREVAHLPYFGSLYAWTRMTGENVLGMRSFSALVGVAGVLVMAAVGNRLGGRHVAITVALLAALNPIHIHYSQEARGYTLWLFMMAVTLYLLCRATRTERVSWWMLYVPSAYLTVLAHYATLAWLPGTAAAVLISPNARSFWRKWWRVHVLLGLALIPIVWWLVIPLAEGGSKPWFQEVWAGYPPILAVPRSIWSMLPSGGYPDYLGALAKSINAMAWYTLASVRPLLRWGPATILFLLGVLTILSKYLPGTPAKNVTPLPNRDLDSERSALDRAIMFLVVLTLAFLMAAFAHSAIVEPTYVVGRYDLAAWPSLLLTVSLLVERVARTFARNGRHIAAIRAIPVLFLLGCSAAVVSGMRLVPVVNDLTRRASRIAELVGPDDLVISLNKYNLFVLYPWHEIGFQAEVKSFPPQHDRQLCWHDAEAELSHPETIERGVREIMAQIQRAIAGGRRVWILTHGRIDDAQWKARWEVDRHLFQRLAESGLDVRPVDEELGLARLVPLAPHSSP